MCGDVSPDTDAGIMLGDVRLPSEMVVAAIVSRLQTFLGREQLSYSKLFRCQKVGLYFAYLKAYLLWQYLTETGLKVR